MAAFQDVTDTLAETRSGVGAVATEATSLVPEIEQGMDGHMADLKLKFTLKILLH